MWKNLVLCPDELEKLIKDFIDFIDDQFSSTFAEWQLISREYSCSVSVRDSADVRVKIEPALWHETEFLVIRFSYASIRGAFGTLYRWEPVYMFVCAPHIHVAHHELSCTFTVLTYPEADPTWELTPAMETPADLKYVLRTLLLNPLT